jgi:branched-chain amino acid aminotransferase
MRSRTKLFPNKKYICCENNKPHLGACLFISNYFLLSPLINFNGALLNSTEKIITADNRGFRYGDGLFETIRVLDDHICLSGFHFERLFSSLAALQFDKPRFFTPDYLQDGILALCTKNNHRRSARVRLTVFRGDGGLYDMNSDALNFVIQTEALQQNGFTLAERGLMTNVFFDGRKSCDLYSNIKSNNFLIHAMAAFHVKKNQLDDSFILNSHDRVCETTISNVFCVINDTICTPPLSEGCVAGVMRRFLLEHLPRAGFLLKETALSIENIKQADEVFLTNAISGVRWVKVFDEVTYHNRLTSAIFDAMLKNFY